MEALKILIGPSAFGNVSIQRLEASGFQVIDNPYKRRLTREELRILLTPDVVGLVAGLEPLDRDILTASALKVISRCGSGMSNVDLEAARALGIAVYSTPDAPVLAVAELAIGVLITMLRSVPAMDSALHRRKWDKRTGVQLSGKTVAVVGYGRIGRKVGELLQAFQTRVLAVDPAVSTLTLDDALPQADIVMLHCSGERCILGESQLQQLKRGAWIVNAARGGLVDEAALARALDSGHVSGAYIDTFETEPYDGPLCGYDQVILTPHIGSYTVECRQRMETEAADNLLRGLRTEHAR
jgi:D-3-phosphoglycerate dehydrogenase